MPVPGSAATLALRMWWPIVLVMALVGGGAGYVAVQDAPYTAVTTLRVNTAGFGEVAQQSIVETARLLVDSNRVYRKIVGDDPVAIEQLRQRTTVDIVTSSSVLEITVTARSAQQAESDVEALAEAAITNFRELAEEQFTSTIESGQSGIENGVLPDPVAEAARRDALGTAIAESQDNALRLSDQLSRIGAVLPATKTGVGARIAALIGGLAGAMLGCALALLVGVGRRRLRTVSDVRLVAPSLIGCEPMERADAVAQAAAVCSRRQYPLAVVLAIPGAEKSLEAVAGLLRSALREDGIRPFMLDQADLGQGSADGGAWRSTDDRQGAVPAPRRNGGDPARNGRHPRAHDTASVAVPALGMPQRAIDLAHLDADLLLFSGLADETTLNRVAARADVVVLVGARGRTTVGDLATVCRPLRPNRLPILVLADAFAEPADQLVQLPAEPEPSGPPNPQPARPAPVSLKKQQAAGTAPVTGTTKAAPTPTPRPRPKPRPSADVGSGPDDQGDRPPSAPSGVPPTSEHRAPVVATAAGDD